MAAGLKDLRKKIKSIQGTRKLTQAMQMVAASKMQKAITQTEKSRPFADLSWQIIENIKDKKGSIEHEFLSERKVNNSFVILITSNRGLCGGLNSQVIKLFHEKLKSEKNNFSIITLGNKGKQFVLKAYKDKLAADFPLPEKLTSFEDVAPIAKLIIDDFKAKKIDKVNIFYNHFYSSISQKPIEKQILPIPKSLNENLETKKRFFSEYKFEPNIDSILEVLLTSIIKIQLQQTILEATASEHSARMVAMKNATDNASDLIDDLTITYNTLRQAAITQEIAEISAGAEALKI